MTLQRRLLLLLLVGAPLIWAVAVGFALWRADLEINELFDTQQVRLAQQVAALLPSAQLTGGLRLPAALPDGKGAADLADLSIAVWNERGELLLADREGAALPFDARAAGFVDRMLGEDKWRVYYLPADGPWRVAVGQVSDERAELLRDLLASQLLPWLLMLPVLLAVLAAAVRRGLRPVREVAREVKERRADRLTPLAIAEAPAELRPLLTEMNELFARIDAALEYERRLTADAAHELRTPLAALRLHWETAQLAGNDADRARAHAQIGVGIERLSHLVSQLLALAGIESRGAPVFTAAVDWHRVVRDVLSDVLPVIEASGCEVSVVWPEDGAPPLPLTGDEALLATLLRNLVDNALRYSPPNSPVLLRFTAQALTVEDSGPGVAAEQLARLGDRFCRPAGQTQSGSGLGISIALRVASLHGLDLQFANRDGGGLRVIVARRAVDEPAAGR